jgi:hypothetical protein
MTNFIQNGFISSGIRMLKKYRPLTNVFTMHPIRPFVATRVFFAVLANRLTGNRVRIDSILTRGSKRIARSFHDFSRIVPTLMIIWRGQSDGGGRERKKSTEIQRLRLFFLVVDRAPKNGARASPELFVLFTRARASLGSSPTQTSP